MIFKHFTFILYRWQVFYLFSCVTTVFSNTPEPPTITKQPDHLQLFQVPTTSDETIRPFTLECEANGSPAPTYYWLKNGHKFDPVAYDKRISQTSKRGSLTFTQPESVDEGLYQCFATNIHGTALSNAVFLRKSELASFSNEDPQRLTVYEGQPLSIDCNPPTGYPKPSIFWYITSKSGALTSINSSRITVDPDGRLHFSNVTLNDELQDSAYACSATTWSRSEYKIGTKVFLKVTRSSSSGTSSVPPKLQYTSPPAMTALRGEQLEIHCIYGGTPLPDVVWKINNNPITGNRYEFTNYGKTLRIPRVDFGEETNYICTASNGAGQSQSHSTRVEVLAAPYWRKSPGNIISAEGETVQFECEAGGKPEPKLQWLMNGRPLDEVPANSRRKLTGSTLVIENLIKSDTSVFQCNASNAHGYAFKNFYLNVLAQPPAIIDRPPPIVSAVATDNVTLPCKVFGAPKPEVRWYRDEVELTGGDYEIFEKGSLRIKGIKYEYAGEYECRAKNKLGGASAKTTLNVKQKTDINHPPVSIEVPAGRIAKFSCSAQADPTLMLQIIWSFRDKEIDYDQNQRMTKYDDNSLIITGTRELDSGEYKCTAKTELDQVSATATLTVVDVPNSPEIIGITCQRYTALIDWKPMGDNRSPITSYTIQYNTSFTPNIWDDALSVPGVDNRHSLSVSPWANYTFRVIAENKVGRSPPSRASGVCSTDPEVPYENPQNVRGWGSAPDNMIISWTPMPQISHNGPGFHYKVSWKPLSISNAAWSSRRIENWQQKEFKVENLPTYLPYLIKVDAINDIGQANTVSREVIGYSGEARPSQSPSNFRLLNLIDYKTATFSWDPVSNESVNGYFVGYKVVVWNDNDGIEKAREIMVGSFETQATIPILKPNTENRVQIMAANRGYTGPGSDIVSVKTDEGPPGPVSKIDAIPMSKSALYVVWAPPEEKNGELKGYKISYREVNGTKLGDIVTRDPILNLVDHKYKLAGLKPATKYRVIVQAFTKGGDSEENYVEESTLSNDSGAVPDVPDFTYQIEEKNGPAVRITWVPSLRSGKPGSYFYVQFRKQGMQLFFFLQFFSLLTE